MKKWLQVISLAISFFLIGLFMPYGMNIPIPSGDIEDVTIIGGDYNPDILILLGILIPIVAVIGLILLYFPKKKEDDLNG